MAQSKRQITASARLSAKRQRRDHSLARRSCQRGARPNALEIAARGAWHDWSDHQDQQRLECLESPIPDGANDLSPWWIHVLTTDPCFLTPTERARCECIMALPAIAGSAPDWSSIVERALAIYHQKAKAGGSSSTLHLYASNYSTNDYSEDVFCDGRGLRLMPAYSCDDLFKSLRREKFNRRRVKRRASQPIPEAFSATFSGFAKELWHGGLSLRNGCAEEFDDWHGVNAALIESLLERGASFATRSPGFFAKHPKAMSPKENDLMAQIDAQRLDEPRARRAVEFHSAPAHAARKKTSL